VFVIVRKLRAGLVSKQKCLKWQWLIAL
jgi:hypothetical protein